MRSGEFKSQSHATDLKLVVHIRILFHFRNSQVGEHGQRHKTSLLGTDSILELEWLAIRLEYLRRETVHIILGYEVIILYLYIHDMHSYYFIHLANIQQGATSPNSPG